MQLRLGSVIASLLIAASTPLLAKEARPSLDLSLPLDLLSGLDGSLTLSCGAPDDSDMLAMIGALQRRDLGGRWESRDDGGRIAASRRGDRFRLRVWEDKVKRLDLKMPWQVAECLFGGRDGGKVRVTVESLKAGSGVKFRLDGDGTRVDVSLD